MLNSSSFKDLDFCSKVIPSIYYMTNSSSYYYCTYVYQVYLLFVTCSYNVTIGWKLITKIQASRNTLYCLCTQRHTFIQTNSIPGILVLQHIQYNNSVTNTNNYNKEKEKNWEEIIKELSDLAELNLNKIKSSD